MRKYEIAVLSKGSYARTVRIYAPKKAKRAIIMHDGQNVFYDEDASYKKSWRALDALRSAKISDTAIVGIDSVDATRGDDYLPFKTELNDIGMPVFGGKAEEYCDYIEQTVMPYLDKRFGFEAYGMLGSSAGALATLHFASRKNAKVKAYGMFSTPLFICETAYAEFFKTADFDNSSLYRVYVGGNEAVGEYKDPELIKQVPDLFVQDAFTLTKALRCGGASDIKLYLDNLSVHDEISWRAPERLFFEDFSKLRI